MVKSFFLDQEGRLKAFRGIVLAVVKKYGSGKKDVNADETFLYQTHLEPKYSVDGRWTTIRGTFKRLVADYVAIGSPATLKTRGSKGSAEGKIPKVSNKYSMDEQQFKDLETMIRNNEDEKEIIKEITDDAKNAILNIYRLNEYTFLSGLQNGVAAVGRNVSKGTEVRADYGYTDDQKLNVAVAGTVEVSDVQKVIDNARKKPTTLFIDAVSLSRIKNSLSFRAAVANSANVVLEDATKYPALNTAQVENYFATEWKIKLVYDVDKIFENENEKAETEIVKAWTDGAMVFASSPKVGNLVNSKTVEHTRRSKLADYAEADYILISKFGELDPLVEFTKAEAEVLPVINADGIYVLNTNSTTDDLPEG